MTQLPAPHPIFHVDLRVTDSSSTNAVSFSSARTMKRFPLSRCASAIQIVRPSRSRAEAQPKLNPALIILLAIVFQYFTPARASSPASSQSAARAGLPPYSTQRAGNPRPLAEDDGLSGVPSEREAFAFISAPACCVGGVPLTRAMNPWAMPEAST